MKILFCFGTRPELIKLAPLIKEFKKQDSLDVASCSTGQHKTMLDQMTQFFNLDIEYNLNLMRRDQSLVGLVSETSGALQHVFEEAIPDWVVVQGDTTTAFVAALVAAYMKIKVMHVEAGLRTNNLYSPFPEEINRQLISRVADLNFTPTKVSEKNLLAEGVLPEKIHTVGNTVIDALLWTENNIFWEEKWRTAFQKASDVVRNADNVVLITGHRRESFGQGFLNICAAIAELSEQYPNWNFVYPVHLNPKVQAPVGQLLSDKKNVYLLSPLDYPQFVYLMHQSSIILTDSGGVQEEAPSLGKPILVMRDTTERPEGVEAGASRLVGTQKERIILGVSSLIDNPSERQKFQGIKNPYGDGLASQRILNKFLEAVSNS